MITTVGPRSLSHQRLHSTVACSLRATYRRLEPRLIAVGPRAHGHPALLRQYVRPKGHERQPGKEIAVELGISPLTVHTHLKHIFEKLGAHTRTEAVVKYLEK